MLRDTINTEYYTDALEFVREVAPTGEFSDKSPAGLFLGVFDEKYDMTGLADNPRKAERFIYSFLKEVGLSDKYIIEEILRTFSEEYTVKWGRDKEGQGKYVVTELD